MEIEIKVIGWKLNLAQGIELSHEPNIAIMLRF